MTLPLEVTVNDVSPECVESIRGNCEKNGYTVREFSLVEEGTDTGRVRNLKFATYLKFATCENTNKINELW